MPSSSSSLGGVETLVVVGVEGGSSTSKHLPLKSCNKVLGILFFAPTKVPSCSGLCKIIPIVTAQNLT